MCVPCRKPPSWRRRLSMAADAARGLAYLHAGMPGKLPIAHNMDYPPTKMALVTSGCGTMCSPEHRMALITSGCGTMSIE